MAGLDPATQPGSPHPATEAGTGQPARGCALWPQEAGGAAPCGGIL